MNSPSLSDHYMPALTGLRFFAVFYIFMHHLYSAYSSNRPKQFAALFSTFDDAPQAMLLLMANGWMSTSLFFLLSGFILSYLYWGQDGHLTISPRQFWVMRAARIYPIHVIVMVFVFAIMAPSHVAAGMPLSTMIPSAVASLLLVQAWVPPWVPVWSWPAWTISALAFLYLITPWLMSVLSLLSRRQMIFALAAMPLVSVIPTIACAALWPVESWGWYLHIFIANTPLFWVPFYAAGILMTRVFSISRFSPPVVDGRLWAWGDVLLVGLIIVACTQAIDAPLKYLIRQGLLMPVYIAVVVDLARGRGLLARFLSLPGTGFFGETAYSIFIWQTVVMACSFMWVEATPSIGPYQVWIAIGAIMVLAIPSTYLIEKPIARLIRRQSIARAP